MAQITVIKRSNYAQRRYERRAKFLAKKHLEAEQQCRSRSVAEIFDSIIKPVEEPTLDTLTHLIVKLKKDVNGSGSCCMPTAALYSTKRFNNKPKTHFGVSADC